MFVASPITLTPWQRRLLLNQRWTPPRRRTARRRVRTADQSATKSMPAAKLERRGDSSRTRRSFERTLHVSTSDSERPGVQRITRLCFQSAFYSDTERNGALSMRDAASSSREEGPEVDLEELGARARAGDADAFESGAAISRDGRWLCIRHPRRFSARRGRGAAGVRHRLLSPQAAGAPGALRRMAARHRALRVSSLQATAAPRSRSTRVGRGHRFKLSGTRANARSPGRAQLVKLATALAVMGL